MVAEAAVPATQVMTKVLVALVSPPMAEALAEARKVKETPTERVVTAAAVAATAAAVIGS